MGPLLLSPEEYAMNGNVPIVPFRETPSSAPSWGDFITTFNASSTPADLVRVYNVSALPCHSMIQCLANGTLPPAVATSSLAAALSLNTTDSITLIYNSSDIHALPAYFSKVQEAIYKINITVISEPFAYQDAALEFDSSVFTLILLVGIGLSVM